MKRRYIKVITFREFIIIADKAGLIFPYNYETIPEIALGIIKDNTFNLIEFSDDAEKMI